MNQPAKALRAEQRKHYATAIDDELEALATMRRAAKKAGAP
jgi:hypothetical protein